MVIDSSDESDDGGASPGAGSKLKLITSLEDDGKKIGGLSKRAALFFDQDIFKDIGADLEEEEDEEEEVTEEGHEEECEEDGEGAEKGSEADSDWEADVGNLEIQDQSDHENGGFEVVPTEKGENSCEGDDNSKEQSNLPK